MRSVGAGSRNRGVKSRPDRCGPQRPSSNTKGRSRRQERGGIPSTPRVEIITDTMANSETISGELDLVARSVVDCAFTVHKELGPGLLESVYQACFCEELKSRGISFQEQIGLPIKYRTLRLDSGLRLDLLVRDSIIVELKSVARIEPIFKAQLLSYLRLSGLKLGFLINFNVPLIREGIVRIAL